LKTRILKPEDRLIVVIDVNKKSGLTRLLSAAGGKVTTVKLGLEMIYSVGLDIVNTAKSFGYKVMLDAKLMDIPNTIKGASGAITGLGPSIVTVHTLGGKKMLEAAVSAMEEHSKKDNSIRPMVFGVTVLTSLDDSDLSSMGFKEGYLPTVKKLVGMALDAGIDGIVCSPQEVEPLRDQFGDDFYIATPGIRLAEDSSGDQKRVNTPGEAISSGADMIIVGRSITSKEDIGGAIDIYLKKIKCVL
jgi:orotidine-5'-phosphate decarboxylase